MSIKIVNSKHNKNPNCEMKQKYLLTAFSLATQETKFVISNIETVIMY